ncbi:MAG: hypothetical protein EOO60_03655, partial [Hymenobacter sp.]
MTVFFMRWVPVATLSVVAAVVLLLLRPPEPLAADAPSTAFAAGRAMRDVAVIAREPHSMG